MSCSEEMLRRGLLPHEVVVVLFLMTYGEDTATEVLAVLGGNPSDGETAVNCPLLALTPTVLITYITIYIKVFTLIALVLLPLEVIVAGGSTETDVPSVEGMMLLTVAEPVAQFEADVTALMCMCIMAPDEPGPEHLALDTPAVAASQWELNLSVGSSQAPEQEVSLECPYPRAVNRLLKDGARLRQVDDGVADDERIAAVTVGDTGNLLFELSHGSHDSRTRHT